MKRRGALLGSNSSRNNRQGFIPMKGLPFVTAFLSLGNTPRCLKKPNDELVSSFPFHPVVVAEHPLELGKVTVNEVGRVRYSHIDVVVPGKQQWEVPLDAQVCATQFPVCIMALARVRIGGSLSEIIFPFCTPLIKHPHKRLLVGPRKHFDYPPSVPHRLRSLDAL